MNLIRFRRSCVFCFTLLTPVIAPMAHLTVGHASVGSGGGGKGTVGSGTSVIEVNDSLKSSVDVFAFLSQSEAKGWRAGEPLGAGGKLPLAYDLSLYKEEPFDQAYVYQNDLRPQYQDFSYIPLWQPIQLGTRLHYRFFPGVWGTMSLDYNGDPAQANAQNANRSLQISELLLKWGPESAPGLSFSMGNLQLYGDYCPLFDQFPLENFRFAGAVAAYNRFYAGSGRARMRLAAGKELLGRTQISDLFIHTNETPFVFLDGMRERYHLYGSASWMALNGFSAGLLAGYQMLPTDSSLQSPQKDSKVTRVWPRSQGWQVGGEAGYRSRSWEHHLTAAYGKGDVQMGWSRPDAVMDPSIDPIYREERFSRKGSSLFHASYRMGFQRGRFGFNSGASWQDRMPAKTLNVSRATASDLVTQDTFNLMAQEFRALKFALQPSYAIGGLVNPVRIGVRYDGIYYLDPNAHTNSIEQLTDAALRPIVDSMGFRLWGPSPWDREAVNCNVVSPFVELDLASGFQVRGSWSGAWYARPVWRQKTADTFHANVTVSALLTYRFAKLDEL